MACATRYVSFVGFTGIPIELQDADTTPSSATLSAPATSRPRSWATALADDATLTAALLDRLLQHAHLVQISGDSYRLKDKKKAGTKPPVPVG